MNLFLAIFLGGGIGAVTRFVISLTVVNHFKSILPIATLIANLIACTIMGIALYWAEAKMETYPWLRGLILIGFCGGLSTFSTFSYETVLLLKANEYWFALGNVIISVFLGGIILYPFLKSIPTP